MMQYLVGECMFDFFGCWMSQELRLLQIGTRRGHPAHVGRQSLPRECLIFLCYWWVAGPLMGQPNLSIVYSGVAGPSYWSLKLFTFPSFFSYFSNTNYVC